MDNPARLDKRSASEGLAPGLVAQHYDLTYEPGNADTYNIIRGFTLGSSAGRANGEFRLFFKDEILTILVTGVQNPLP